MKKNIYSLLILFLSSSYNVNYMQSSNEPSRAQRMSSELCKKWFSFTTNKKLIETIEKIKKADSIPQDIPKNILLIGPSNAGAFDKTCSLTQETEKDYFILPAWLLVSEYHQGGDKKIKAILKEMTDENKPVIIVLSEIHTIIKEEKTSTDDLEALKKILEECKKNKYIYVFGTAIYEKSSPKEMSTLFNDYNTNFTAKDLSLEERDELLQIYLSENSFNCNSANRKEILNEMKTAEPQHVKEVVDLSVLWSLRRDKKNTMIEREDFQPQLRKYKEYETERINKENEWTWERGANVAYRLSAAICIAGTITKIFPCWGPK